MKTNRAERTDGLNSLKSEDAAANAAMVSEGGHVDVPTAVRNEARDDATRKAVQATGAAQRASDAADVAQAAREDDRARDTPADEAMSTTNRQADHPAYSAHRVAHKADTMARDAASEAKRCGGGKLAQTPSLRGRQRTCSANNGSPLHA